MATLTRLALALLAGSVGLAAQVRSAGAPAPRTITVSGVVRDEAGRAIGGATVIALRCPADRTEAEYDMPTLGARFPHEDCNAQNGGATEIARMQTGPDGKFRFDVELGRAGIAEGHDLIRGAVSIPAVSVAAFTADFASSMWIAVGSMPAGSNDAQSLTVVVYPRARLAVQVLDANGRPVVGEAVTVAESRTDWIGRMMLTRAATSYRGGPFRFEATTDAEGRARFRPPFGANLQVVCPAIRMLTVADRPRLGTIRDRLAANGSEPPLRLARGESRELVMRPPAPVRIGGRIVKTDGTALAGAHVDYLGHHAEADADGRFVFDRPLSPGGPLYARPADRDWFHQEIIPPAAGGGAVDVTIPAGRQDVEVRLNRTDCTARAWVEGGIEARAHVVVTAAAGNRERIGFYVERGRRVDGPTIDLKVPDFAFDASLEVGIIPQSGDSIRGVVCLVCTGVDRYPGVTVVAERLVVAASTARFPELQAGSYLVGFVPYAGNEALFTAPGEPRLTPHPTQAEEEDDDGEGGERHAWIAPTAQRLADARPGARWHALHVKPGRNGVTLDLRERAGLGRLEIAPVDRHGKPLGEFVATLMEAPGLIASRISGPDGTIVVEGVPAGIYELMLESPLEPLLYDRIPVVIPARGTLRQRVVMDVVAPDTPAPPLLAQRGDRPTAAESSYAAMRRAMLRCLRFIRRGESDVARILAKPWFERAAKSGHAAALLTVLFGGTEEGGRTLPLETSDAARLGIPTTAGGAPRRRAVLDALWRTITTSEAYATQRMFRLAMNTLRLEHLVRYPADRETDRATFRALTRETRTALDHPACRSVARRYRRQLDNLEREAAKKK